MVKKKAPLPYYAYIVLDSGRDWQPVVLQEHLENVSQLEVTVYAHGPEFATRDSAVEWAEELIGNLVS